MQKIIKLLSNSVFGAGAIAVALLSPTILTSALAAESDAIDWSGAYVGVSIGYANTSAHFEDRSYAWNGSTLEHINNNLTFGAQLGRYCKIHQQHYR